MTRTEAETDGLLEALGAACRERDTARRELQETQVAHHAAEAECIDLRARLVVAERERDERPVPPSAAFTLGRLIGVTIGAALVGGAAGVEVALRWLSW